MLTFKELEKVVKQLEEAVGYLRLSRDDGDDESSSITNQRAIIKEWARANGFIITDWYVDDNVSGYTMDRPSFNRLKNDLNDDKVKTIIVKDLSRLGRHNAKVNLFLENIEECGKRVIALGERYDTYDPHSHEMVGITTWMNEKYVKDTSRKVRESITKMQDEGRYISNVPYGYVLDLYNKGTYHVDNTCAMYVQEMFDMYLSGLGIQAIAKEFTMRGVPTGNQITKQRLERRGQSYSKKSKNIWHARVIHTMLRNDFYIGTLTLAKSKRRTINGKAVIQDKEDMVVFENAHEPLVDKRTFYLVQEVMAERNRNKYRGQKQQRTRNVYAGKMYCADCGERMTVTYSKVQKRYVCKNYHMFGTDICQSHAIHEGILNESITYFLEHCRNNLSEAIKDLDVSIKKNSSDNGETIYILEKDLQRIEKELEVLFEQKMRDTMSNPTMKDIIDKTYSTMINSKYADIKSINEQLSELRNSLMDGNDTRKELTDVLDIFDNIILSQTINRRQVETIIDKIVVHNDNGLDIYLKGDLHELCTNYVQYKNARTDKMINDLLEYCKQNKDRVVPTNAELYVRKCGNKIGKKNFHQFFASLVSKGYFVENEGYRNGYRVVDLDKLIVDTQSNTVIDYTPRVEYNIVTLELINKICAWVRTTKHMKKLF